MKWISPDFWLDNEARRIRRRSVVKWVDRVGWSALAIAVLFFIIHLALWAWRVWAPR